MNNSNNRTSILIKDTGLFAISSFGSKILIFLLTPLYTSILTTEEYGIADLITTTINFIYPILTLAIADATLRFALDNEQDKRKVLDNSLLITLLSVLILIFLYPILINISPNVSEYWTLFVVTYALFNIHNCISNFIKAIGKTSLFAIQGLLQTVIIVLSNMLFLIILKKGFQGYFISIIIGYAIPILFLLVKGNIYSYITPVRIDKILLKEMLWYSIPMIPTLLAWAINTSVDKYMIIYMIGLSDSGIYSVAHKIPTIFTAVITIFTQAWQLSAISNYGSSDESEYHTVVYNVLNIISLIGCMIIIALSKILASILFAKDFYTAWRYVPFLTVSAMFASHGGFLASEFRAAKKTKSLFMSVVLGSIVNIVLNYIFIRKYGAFGAALATVISFVIIWLFRFILIQKIVRVRINVLSTIICYSLLIIEAVLVTLDLQNIEYVYIFLVFVVLLFIRKDLLNIVSKIFQIIKHC